MRRHHAAALATQASRPTPAAPMCADRPRMSFVWQARDRGRPKAAAAAATETAAAVAAACWLVGRSGTYRAVSQ